MQLRRTSGMTGLEPRRSAASPPSTRPDEPSDDPLPRCLPCLVAEDGGGITGAACMSQRSMQDLRLCSSRLKRMESVLEMSRDFCLCMACRRFFLLYRLVLHRFSTTDPLQAGEEATHVGVVAVERSCCSVGTTAVILGIQRVDGDVDQMEDHFTPIHVSVRPSSTYRWRFTVLKALALPMSASALLWSFAMNFMSTMMSWWTVWWSIPASSGSRSRMTVSSSGDGVWPTRGTEASGLKRPEKQTEEKTGG
ncbi:hypothetical protein EYF80_005496 [Liparis tanakae]|uniref:Uncharacterized protein n=1 Tax=Liparis tanakae TaxID=230148 RepID=A0A4Z2J1R5_9TELE|nr:hypothetical protein EYF80_005496 [Liparis tanakae]